MSFSRADGRAIVRAVSGRTARAATAERLAVRTDLAQRYEGGVVPRWFHDYVDETAKFVEEGNQPQVVKGCPIAPRTKCRGADLTGVDLSGANLEGAHLQISDFTGADLSGANLNGAVLSAGNLSGVDLSGADLRSAHLFHADLSRANLRGVDLRSAWVVDATVAGANFAGASVEGTIFDRTFPSNTVCPDGTVATYPESNCWESRPW